MMKIKRLSLLTLSLVIAAQVFAAGDEKNGHAYFTKAELPDMSKILPPPPEFKAKQAEATKVASTRAVAQAEGTARIYRLDGTPASESSRGLLIQNNKKVILR